jgi:hypothetical protein
MAVRFAPITLLGIEGSMDLLLRHYSAYHLCGAKKGHFHPLKVGLGCLGNGRSSRVLVSHLLPRTTNFIRLHDPADVNVYNLYDYTTVEIIY